MKNLFRYIRNDLHRALFNWRFFVVTILCIAVLLLNGIQTHPMITSVMDIFQISFMDMPPRVLFVCCTYLYAISFCEDCEHKYIMLLLRRGDVNSYIWARLISIFLSCEMVAIISASVYANVLHISHPWSSQNSLEFMEKASNYFYFIKNGWYGVYITLFAIQFGAWIGSFAVISAGL